MITVEHVDFISIPTQDVPRAKRFYGELLGLRAREGHARRRRVPRRPGDARDLGAREPGPAVQPNQSGFALRVADVAEARRELEERASTFDMETFDTGVCHMALMRDPDGNQIILHRRYAP